MIGTPYMGTGPHVGHEGKFEVLLLPSEADHVTFLRDQFGLKIRQTQRWLIHDTDSLIVVAHERQGSLRKDTPLHGHLVFNLAVNLLDAYRHYSYDTPCWLLEGLGHFMEREIDPRCNTFDGSEGATAAETRKSDWDAAVKKLIRARKAPRIAELLQLSDYADFELPHHFVTWSLTKFMIEEHPEAYASLTQALHGRMDEEGYPDGTDLVGCHREAVREYFGMTHAQLDEAWAEWALQD